MTYDGNQVKSVTDRYGSQNQYAVKEYNDKSNTTVEFSYDKNGNMIKDLDREIVTIRYNLLNLPDTIQFKNGNRITNIYSADGRKLKTEYITLITALNAPITEGTVYNYPFGDLSESASCYIDNLEYCSSNDRSGSSYLLRIHNPEGYYVPMASYYTYYRKDHLGNIREVWQANRNRTIQRTQYYPSGLPWAEGSSPSEQPYKYNGKEFIQMHGYDMYDYGARGYYAASGRFTTVDPLAEKHPEISTYAFCSNNPINRVDPDGRSDYSFSKEGKLDKYVANDKPDRIMVESGKNDSGEKAYTTLDADGVKQFVAIVVGEATNNKDEATGIANVMLNRMDYKDVDLKSGFVDKIGGKKDFDAIDGKQYNKVMGQSLKETLDSNVGVRVEGAMSALSPLTGDNTNGAFFWNATSQKNAKNPGWNWTQYDKKVYSKTAEKGGTTFFKYNPNKSENPKHYKSVWP